MAGELPGDSGLCKPTICYHVTLHVDTARGRPGHLSVSVCSGQHHKGGAGFTRVVHLLGSAAE